MEKGLVKPKNPVPVIFLRSKCFKLNGFTVRGKNMFNDVFYNELNLEISNVKVNLRGACAMELAQATSAKTILDHLRLEKEFSLMKIFPLAPEEYEEFKDEYSHVS